MNFFTFPTVIKSVRQFLDSPPDDAKLEPCVERIRQRHLVYELAGEGVDVLAKQFTSRKLAVNIDVLVAAFIVMIETGAHLSRENRIGRRGRDQRFQYLVVRLLGRIDKRGLPRESDYGEVLRIANDCCDVLRRQATRMNGGRLPHATCNMLARKRDELVLASAAVSILAKAWELRRHKQVSYPNHAQS